MADPRTALVWPRDLLKPAQILPNLVPFSRTGGRSLGGLERSIRTDRGYWSIAYKGIALGETARRRSWNAIRTALGGMAGTLAVPVWSYDSAPWAAGTDGRTLVTHSNGTTFSTGAKYRGSTIGVQMATNAALGATVVTLRLLGGIDTLAGVRFSYRHALYETGPASLVSGNLWTVPVFPAVRARIPADATLEFDMPTCLVHLATDRAMDGSLSVGNSDKADVAFIEAVDVFNDIAGG